MDYSHADIQILSGLEAVRRRPGMYLGSTNARGLHHAALELISNAIDQQLLGEASICRVRIEGRTLVLEDDGRGMPFDVPDAKEAGRSMAEWQLTTLHAHGHKAPHVHLLNPYGVGLPVVCALAERLEVRSQRPSGQYRQTYIRGEALDGPVLDRTAAGSGTMLRFTPDPMIFGDHVFDPEVLRAHMWRAVHILPGIALQFEDEHWRPVQNLRPLLAAYGAGVEARPIPLTLGGYRAWAAFEPAQGQHPSSVHVFVNGVRTGGDPEQVIHDALASAQLEGSSVALSLIGQEHQFAGPTRAEIRWPSDLKTQLFEQLCASFLTQT